MFRPKDHSPDILSFLSSLSNDEVFTPPEVANRMLDLLPDSIWENPNAKFLDPCCKTGVFLREIVKRLNRGLEKKIPDLQKRIDHILTKQVFGIATSELTAMISRRTVYCSKEANGKYSICTLFDNEEGNIVYRRVNHNFVKSKCTNCGASQRSTTTQNCDASENNYSDSEKEKKENYAYPFIHEYSDSRIEEILNMKFDVIVGNPPYQMEVSIDKDSVNSKQAIPLYHLFVDKAKRMNSDYILMIIPSRWFSGGRGLDEFRENMFSDGKIEVLVDYPNSREVFSEVAIAGGVCYFLWNRNFEGLCKVITVENGNSSISYRDLINEFNNNSIFVRFNQAKSIIDKITEVHRGTMLNEVVSSRKPFDIESDYEFTENGVPCWFNSERGLKYVNFKDIKDKFDTLHKWKVIALKAPGIPAKNFSGKIRLYNNDNKVIVAEPGTCCSDSWLVIKTFDTKEEAESFVTYLRTKVVQFLILSTVVSQNTSKKNFAFVPDLGKYEGVYTDERLCEMWGITKEEFEFIESKVE